MLHVSNETTEALADMVKQASEAYDQMCQDRHDMGAEKYGPVKFMEIDSIEMALEEIADLGNYARYTWIKLHMIQAAVANIELPVTPTPMAFFPAHEKE